MALALEQGMKNNYGALKTRIAEAADIPKDVALGAPVLVLTGRTELTIENYMGILEYTEEYVRIRCRGGEIRVDGKKLLIEYYTNLDMKITGWISSVAFPEQGT